MKSLYITFIELKSGDGISKKVKAQYQALRDGGMDIELTCFEVRQGVKYYKIGDEELHLGSRLIAKLRSAEKFKSLLRYVKLNGVEFIYIRYTSDASAGYINFLKALKSLGVIIYLEIPTYPYDGEFSSKNPYKLYNFKREQFFRGSLHKAVARIVTYSEDNEIFGVKCVNISNAIAFDSIELRVEKPKHDYVKFLAVATLGFWHGYDRMIEALSRHLASELDVKIYFDIVGQGPALEELEQRVAERGLGEYVTFHGRKEGDELTQLFQDADICVGSLGRHRSGISEMRALKNVEYATRGIPFIYSETNPDFDSMPYIYKVSPDEKPIDIREIITSLDYKNYEPKAIRQSVTHLSWDSQMALVRATLQK